MSAHLNPSTHSVPHTTPNDDSTLHKARYNMIYQQMRTWDVNDERILALYQRIHRDRFIEDSHQKSLAYADLMLPISEGQVMLEPKLEARMLLALTAKKCTKVLHIGTGSGFFSALLRTHLDCQVISVECRQTIADTARNKLQQNQIDNVDVIHADGINGLVQLAPFDAISITGSVPTINEKLFDQLKPGGQLLAFVGRAPIMSLRRLVKHPSNTVTSQDILETFVPPLDNINTRPPFEF